MDRLTRKELKSDRFALEVQHSVEYVSEHRRQLTRWGSIAAAVAVVLIASFLYRKHERSIRQEALRAASRIQNAAIGPPSSEYVVSFPTAADRDKALVKAYSEMAAKYSGTDEALIAEIGLGINAADQGKLAEAARHFKIAADGGNGPYSSLAKLSLAQVYASQGKQADGEKLIQSVIDHPTVLVSKEAATIAMAELIGPKDPQRARKLLEPLLGHPRPGVHQTALTVISELPKK